MLNRFMGAVLNFIFYTPLLLLQSVLVFLLFIDKIIAGEYRAALLELVWSPVKILQMLLFSSQLVISSGWGSGFTGLFDFSFARMTTYWNDFYHTDANYFSSLFCQLHIDMYQGHYIGVLAHKMSLLFFASYFLDLYKNYNYSPHNPRITYSVNQIYDIIDRQYGLHTKEKLTDIYQNIKQFLHNQTPVTNEDQTYILACRSLEHMKTGVLINAHDYKSSVNHALEKTPFNTLCLVWTVLECRNISPERKLQLKAVLATYLANLQRNLSASENALDLEECGTGFIGTLLDFLKVIDPKEFDIQLPQTESWSVMQGLLNERLNQKHYLKVNADLMAERITKRPLPTNPAENPAKKREDFIKENRLALRYYARFLNNTPQGQATTGFGHLDDAGVDETTNYVLDNWVTPQ